MSDITELFPITEGDTFVIGPDHFVCIGWENGRIKAMTHDRHGLYTYAFSPDFLLSPGFRMLNTYYPKELLALAKARGVDEEQLIRDIECNAAIQHCHPSEVARALLEVLQADWGESTFPGESIP